MTQKPPASRPRSAPRPSASDTDIPGLAARRVAADAVAEALARNATLEDGQAFGQLPPDDAALARAIAVSTFRRFGQLRAVLEEVLDRGLPPEPKAVAILMTGAAQILVMDVPDHAAVDLAVRLARADRRTTHLPGLVNAVLRRIARDRPAPDLAPEAELPGWLAERWARIYGRARLPGLCAAIREGAPIDLTLRADPELWAERLGGHLLPTGSLRLADRTRIEELPGFAEGAWWVQDAAAALPARLLAPRPGERILDLCAAPGGKTAQLAAAGADVVALDRSASRLKRLRENFARLNLPVEVVAADALAYAAEPFDAVLLDAPCTGTGTLRRHPDIGWTKGAADLASLARLQTRLLDKAAALVKPGGRLVYCVCSLEPEEGEDQARNFAARHPAFRHAPVDAASLGLDARAVTPAGDLRTVPDLWVADGERRGGLDGFFAACWRRTDDGPAGDRP